MGGCLKIYVYIELLCIKQTKYKFNIKYYLKLFMHKMRNCKLHNHIYPNNVISLQIIIE